MLFRSRGHQDELFSYVVLRRGPREEVRWRHGGTGVTLFLTLSALCPLTDAILQAPEVAVALEASPLRDTPSDSSPSWHLPESVIRRQMLLNRLYGAQTGGGQHPSESGGDDAAVTAVEGGNNERQHGSARDQLRMQVEWAEGGM